MNDPTGFHRDSRRDRPLPGLVGGSWQQVRGCGRRALGIFTASVPLLCRDWQWVLGLVEHTAKRHRWAAVSKETGDAVSLFVV